MSAQTQVHIRPAYPNDVPHLQCLESRCDQLFRTVDMAAIGDSTPPSLDLYSLYEQCGHMWVAAPTEAEPGTPIAFVQVDLYKNNDFFRTVYIHQIAVDPEYAGRGIGARLIALVEGWAREREYKGVDLTTFDDVPWNRPYYERLGFKVLSEEELTGEDAKCIREEKEREERDELLGRWKRVAMRKVFD